MRTHSKKRLSDNICMRISTDTRAYLENVADQKRIAIGEAARELLELGIKAQSGAVEC